MKKKYCKNEDRGETRGWFPVCETSPCDEDNAWHAPGVHSGDGPDRISELEGRMGEIERSLDELKELVAGHHASDCRGCSRTRMDCIDEIMKNFDFAKVAEVMRFLDWKWAGPGGASVPDAIRIRDSSHKLLLSAWNGLDDEAITDGDGWREWQVSTGGLTAWVCEREDNPEERYAKLSFNLEEWFVEP